MLYPSGAWALGIKTIREFTHEEFLAPKYTKSKALKHLKVFIYVYFLININETVPVS